jgi:CRISPR-associated protein Cas8b1/Cst1 subtype I-B
VIGVYFWGFEVGLPICEAVRYFYLLLFFCLQEAFVVYPYSVSLLHQLTIQYTYSTNRNKARLSKFEP